MVFWAPDSWSGLEIPRCSTRAELPRTTRELRSSRGAGAPRWAPRTAQPRWLDTKFNYMEYNYVECYSTITIYIGKYN